MPLHGDALEYTRTKNVFIAGIVHNNAKSLDSSLRLMDAIGSLFAYYSIGIYENDSTDKSPEILAEWKAQHPHSSRVHIVSEQLDTASAISHGGISAARFEKMGQYRNQYMDLFDKHGNDADFLIVLDMDIFDVSVDGILSSFAPAVRDQYRWSAVGANGVYDGQRYYDTLAFRDATFTDTRIKAQRDAAHVRMHPGQAWVPAESMFGGLVIYRADCVHGCRYEADGDCEHVSIYKCMRRRSLLQRRPQCGRFFVNVNMLLDYQNFQLYWR
jgi:hypothetical protein